MHGGDEAAAAVRGAIGEGQGNEVDGVETGGDLGIGQEAGPMNGVFEAELFDSPIQAAQVARVLAAVDCVAAAADEDQARVGSAAAESSQGVYEIVDAFDRFDKSEMTDAGRYSSFAPRRWRRAARSQEARQLRLILLPMGISRRWGRLCRRAWSS